MPLIARNEGTIKWIASESSRSWSQPATSCMPKHTIWLLIFLCFFIIYIASSPARAPPAHLKLAGKVLLIRQSLGCLPIDRFCIKEYKKMEANWESTRERDLWVCWWRAQAQAPLCMAINTSSCSAAASIDCVWCDESLAESLLEWCWGSQMILHV